MRFSGLLVAAVVATALGTLALCWAAFGAKLVPNCPFVLHESLAIVAGTAVIFLVGFLMGRLFGRKTEGWGVAKGDA